MYSSLKVGLTISASGSIPSSQGKVSYNSACAAAGQLGLMSLYEIMFNQFDITTSQLLVTAFDFTSPERRRNIQYVISELLALGIVPLLNENDAVSANQGYQLFGNSFADNDSLAALVSIEMSAQLLILLTDVHGVYDRPPNDPQARLIDVFSRTTDFKVGKYFKNDSFSHIFALVMGFQGWQMFQKGSFHTFELLLIEHNFYKMDLMRFPT